MVRRDAPEELTVSAVPHDRDTLLTLRGAALRVIQHLGHARGTLSSQVSTIEKSIALFDDKTPFEKIRELRTRAKNLRLAIMAIECELSSVQLAADNVTRQLAAERGVTLT